MKGESYDAGISSIILRTEDMRLHRIGYEVNDHLREEFKVKNVDITENSNRIKPKHLNKNRLHLKNNVSRMLGSTYTREKCQLKKQ